MISINPIRTHIFKVGDTLSSIANQVQTLPPKSVLAITSKIVSLCQNRICQTDDKINLIKQESDIYIGPQTEDSIHLTIKDGTVIFTAGIDSSNSETGQYILWPTHCFQACKIIWEELAKKFSHQDFGVIITDSRLSIMRKGVTGICLGFFGFKALKNYIGSQDLFGRELKVTQCNNIDSLANMAVFAMGESNESTPLALITGLNQLTFCETTQQDMEDIKIAPENDVYLGQLIRSLKKPDSTDAA